MKEEKVINDVLHVRFSPEGKFRPYSKAQLTCFLMELRENYADIIKAHTDSLEEREIRFDAKPPNFDEMIEEGVKHELRNFGQKDE